MPAKTPYRIGVTQDNEDVLEIRLTKEDLEPNRSVYFMDQSPEFEVVVENIGEKRIEGATYLRFSFTESNSEPESGTHKRLEIELEAGEKESFSHRIDMLPYQGTAALAIDRPRIRDCDDRFEISRMSSSNLERLYTFMVYDRDYYKMNYLWPRRAQYIAAFLSVLIVLIGVLQLTG